jgi:hypothetical protein
MLLDTLLEARLYAKPHSQSEALGTSYFDTKSHSSIMRIELFKLAKQPPDFDLKSRLEAIVKTPLKERNRLRKNDYIRLEAHAQRGHLWFCDFVKIRTHHGPARAGLSRPAKGFDLLDDEGFGEETCFLWDSTNDWCVIQYNHYGVRPAAIAEYLGLFVHNQPVLLELLPKLDDKIHAKINAKKLVTKVSLSVAPKQLSNHDYDLGAGLGEATKALRKSEADRVEITITAAKRSGGLHFKLLDLMNWVNKLGGGHEGSPVTTARATAMEDEKAEAEVLDLLHHRITTEVDLTPGKDKRYSQKDRWDANHQAHTAWKHLMK